MVLVSLLPTWNNVWSLHMLKTQKYLVYTKMKIIMIKTRTIIALKKH